MIRRLMVFAMLAVSAVGITGAGDILQALSVAKDDATRAVVSSLAHGNVDYWVVRNAFKAASPAMRVAWTEQVLVWTKAYVSSPQFAKDYAAYREQAKPQPPETKGSVDEELKQMRAQRQQELEQTRKSIAEMPVEYRAAAEEGLKAAADAMKQMDTPEFRKMERDGIVARRQDEQNRYDQDVERWQEEYPADPRALVRKRLAEFLERTAAVDYAAKLVSSGGRMRFANADYESNPPEWKLAYRAGKEATEKARAFAQAWLEELE